MREVRSEKGKGRRREMEHIARLRLVVSYTLSEMKEKEMKKGWTPTNKTRIHAYTLHFISLSSTQLNSEPESEPKPEPSIAKLKKKSRLHRPQRVNGEVVK